MQVKTTSPENARVLSLSLEGSLLDDSSVLPNFDFSKYDGVQMNLHGFKAINSVGIMLFLNWMKQFQYIPVEFMECPKFFIDQINMINGLLPPTAKVVSFNVPYYCEATDQSRQVLYRFGYEFEKQSDTVSLKHPHVAGQGKEKFELDVVEWKFFKFLDRFG